MNPESSVQFPINETHSKLKSSMDVSGSKMVKTEQLGSTAVIESKKRTWPDLTETVAVLTNEGTVADIPTNVTQNLASMGEFLRAIKPKRRLKQGPLQSITDVVTASSVSESTILNEISSSLLLLSQRQ